MELPLLAHNININGKIFGLLGCQVDAPVFLSSPTHTEIILHLGTLCFDTVHAKFSFGDTMLWYSSCQVLIWGHYALIQFMPSSHPCLVSSMVKGSCSSEGGGDILWERDHCNNHLNAICKVSKCHLNAAKHASPNIVINSWIPSFHGSWYWKEKKAWESCGQWTPKCSLLCCKSIFFFASRTFCE